jgi:DNA polymerase-3 subunit epsilon
MDFVAIDFETANGSRNSACSLGVVIVKQGRIVDRRYSLINPQTNFQRYCTYIHGITESAVKNAPTFSDIYPVLFDMLNGQVLVAHNAPFDVAVLKASCDGRGLATPRVDPFCSVEMARIAWPELPHHRLNSLAEQFHLDLRHHNAIGDATACAQLVLLCADQFGANNIAELRGMLAIKDRRNREEAKAKKAREEAEAAAIAAIERDAALREEAKIPALF